MRAKAKRAYEKHKEKIREKARVAHVCECGGTYCTLLFIKVFWLVRWGLQKQPDDKFLLKSRLLYATAFESLKAHAALHVPRPQPPLRGGGRGLDTPYSSYCRGKCIRTIIPFEALDSIARFSKSSDNNRWGTQHELTFSWTVFSDESIGQVTDDYGWK